MSGFCGPSVFPVRKPFWMDTSFKANQRRTGTVLFRWSHPVPNPNQARRIGWEPADSLLLIAGGLRYLHSVPYFAWYLREKIPGRDRSPESPVDRELLVTHCMPLESPASVVSFQDSPHSRPGQQGSELHLAPSNQYFPLLPSPLSRMLGSRVSR